MNGLSHGSRSIWRLLMCARRDLSMICPFYYPFFPHQVKSALPNKTPCFQENYPSPVHCVLFVVPSLWCWLHGTPALSAVTCPPPMLLKQPLPQILQSALSKHFTSLLSHLLDPVPCLSASFATRSRRRHSRTFVTFLVANGQACP